METLITIAIIVAAVIWHAIQRRKEEGGDATPWLPPMRKGDQAERDRPAPPSLPQPPTEPPRSWEEELRRLLGDEPAQPPPPPVIVYQQPAPVPPPLPVPTRSRSRPPPATMSLEEDSMAVGLPVLMPSLSQSAEALRRASQLEAAVAQRLRKVDEQLVSHGRVVQLFQAPPEIRQAIALLRNRSSQRAAIVASVVLGPPKALGE